MESSREHLGDNDIMVLTVVGHPSAEIAGSQAAKPCITCCLPMWRRAHQ
jgi:hypothetical protein